MHIDSNDKLSISTILNNAMSSSSKNNTSRIIIVSNIDWITYFTTRVGILYNNNDTNNNNDYNINNNNTNENIKINNFTSLCHGIIQLSHSNDDIATHSSIINNKINNMVLKATLMVHKCLLFVN